jgi:hypothetical protein
VASTVNTGLSTFTSPWSTVLGQSFSSFSTSYGAIATKQEVHTSTVFTSSVVLSGLRQPFIQYGSATLSGSGTATVNGGSGLLPYRDALYAVQLTYSNATAPTTLLTVTGRASNSFDVAGSNSAAFFWTTFGNLF